MNNQQIFNLLKQQVIGLQGNITFTLGNISVAIGEKDVVGNCIQSWLYEWFIANNISFGNRPNTQEFPDYIINPNSSNEEYLEVKAWNYDASPAFDIANFQSYCQTLETSSERLDSDYLLFGYRMINGNIEIVDIFLKKVWEITGSSGAYPVKVQQKRGVIYNLRPITWYRPVRNLPRFTSRRDFALALDSTLNMYSTTAVNSVNWFNRVEADYYSKTGNLL